MPDQAAVPFNAEDPPAPPAVQQDPDSDDRLGRLVDLQSANSFPASDPPSFWAGE